MTTYPTFACGQVLTSDDLNKIISWVTSIRRLAGQRDGWGVVQGLDVSATPPGKVTVGPGYAVSPAGEDLVLPAADQSTPLDTKPGTYDVSIAYAETKSGDKDHPLVTEGVKITVTAAANARTVVNKAIAEAKELDLANENALRDWLTKLVTANPPSGACFNAKWITDPWGQLPGYFLQLLGWWAADMLRTAAEKRPISNELTLAQVVVGANGDPTVDMTVRRMLHGPLDGARLPTDAYGRGLSEATAMLTGRGVIVSEWAEWNPGTVDEVSTLFPAPAVGAGALVRIWHATPPGGSTPWVAGLTVIGTLP
jgi:hypothetical protein